MSSVAVLFARHDSAYKRILGADVYDADRDARTYDGPFPVIAHPPCRAWGRLRKFAKPRDDERNLSRLAVSLVREFGGILEHPKGSTLWKAQGLPTPGELDHLGGWTFEAPQMWWGHRAEKLTWFYIVGCTPCHLPEIPYIRTKPTHVIQSRKRSGYLPHVPKAEREKTPPAMAEWLVELAGKCRSGQ